MHNGTPTVFIDDQPAFFGCHLIGSMDPAQMLLEQPYMRRYAEAGVHIYSTGTPNETWPGPRPDNPYPYDFSMVLPGMQPYIDADPQALFLVRMAFDTRWPPGKWWNKAYPDEVEVLSDGARWGNSFASTVWQEQVKGQLRDFIPYLKQAGLYDRVLGFQIGAGSSGEWIKDMSCMLLPTMDYSPPMRRHFRAWLRQRYQGDDGRAAGRLGRPAGNVRHGRGAVAGRAVQHGHRRLVPRPAPRAQDHRLLRMLCRAVRRRLHQLLPKPCAR